MLLSTSKMIHMDDLEELFIAQNNLHELEENENAPRQYIRRGDPFTQLSETRFTNYFRLSKDLTRELIAAVTPFVPGPTRESAISVVTKVLVALKFYGYGSYQEITGTNIYTGVSQPTASRAIEEVTNALNRPEIFDQWIKFPNNILQLRESRTRFYRKYHLPGAIGCIDCTHVAIVPPHGEAFPEHIYVNGKGFHSINVQLTCDENLKILHINARFPGSSHDAHIFRESNISQIMENIYRRNPYDHFFLLGDSGYPLRPWLQTPLRQIPEHNSPEERFNNTLKTARSTIERCNGVLKSRFRCLLKDRVLHYQPPKASRIINACAVLHNMCISRNLPVEDIIIENNDGLYFHEELENNRAANEDLLRGRQLQNTIIINHFR